MPSGRDSFRRNRVAPTDSSILSLTPRTQLVVGSPVSVFRMDGPYTLVPAGRGCSGARFLLVKQQLGTGVRRGR
jgi:hypothetical protein